VLNEFRTGNSPIMIATDVASRGIGNNNTILVTLKHYIILEM